MDERSQEPNEARPPQPIPGGELRVSSRRRRELEALGLCDPEAWRQGRVEGRVVHRRRERSVLRIESEGGVLYAKHQRGRRTGEWMRELVRLRKPLSSAAREARASEALIALGIDAPQVLLEGETRGVGGVELESFLVCETLSGTPLEESALDAELAQGLARLAWRLSEARVAVPDLYAKHVHVRRAADGSLRFGLLDLPRVEPRARRSARELFVRHAAGLVASVPGLEAAGMAAATPWGAERRLLAAVEDRAALVRKRKKLPQPYAARERYATDADVRNYEDRSKLRHAAELVLLDQALPARIEGTVIDAPCGAGRFSSLLRERGARVVAMDLSPAMVRTARTHAGMGAVAELEHLPLSTDSLAGALCFRFLHHVPTSSQRRRVLSELTRVSREFVVFSVFHPISAHNVLRTTRRALTRRPASRHTVSMGQLARDLEACGWRLDAAWPQTRFMRDLWVVRAVPRG